VGEAEEIEGFLMERTRRGEWMIDGARILSF